MKISRRIAIVAIAAVAVLPLAGCPNQNETAALIQIVGQSVVTLASIQGNPALADQLNAASAAAVTAVTNWKPGQPADQVTQALNVLVKNINLIPVDTQTKVYITLAVTTVNSILAIVAPSATVPGRAASTRTAKATEPAPLTAKDYKARWNALRASNTAVPALK